MPKKTKKKLKKGGVKKKISFLHPETKKGVLVIIFFTFAAVSLLSFLGVAGTFGEYFFKLSVMLFGKGFFLVSISFVLAGLAVLLPGFGFGGRSNPVYRTILSGMALFIFSVLGLFHILTAEGGYLGLVLGYPSSKFLGFWAGLVVLFAVLAISILITFNISLIPARAVKSSSAKSSEDEKEESLAVEVKNSVWQRLKRKSDLPDNKPEIGGDHIVGKEAAPDVKAKAKATVIPMVSISDGLNKQFSGFQLPPLEFLEKDVGQPTSGDIKANINIIKRTLENFGIEVEMAEVNVGPTVTQYTLRPAQGVKLAKITSLQNDLALALAAHPLRIEAPIPKRSLVGIEIPNKSMVLVRLRTLLERPAFQESTAGLVLALGRDVAGKPVFADLSQMPHLLVSGATGTGKTIALNNVILSLLYRALPENLKLILIDPKRVELTAYSNIPHLLTPVIVKPDKAVGALRWAVGEMERRFGVLQGAGKRDIGSYNKDIDGERLPYIVIVIDELADLMSSYGREAEGAIVRIAQMARAVGIHLIVATQRPSVEVITGLIKANITSRMAFQVASQIDSRTILDMGGAEKLLGNGDMLFLAGNSAKPIRVQGGYVSEKEIKKVTDYLRKGCEPEYKDELDSSGTESRRTSFSADGSEADDELYEEAKAEVIRAGKASASLLQRRLRVGYARAARLIDILEDRGVVGPSDGAKARDVFEDKGEEEI
ncbi:DNA translocase FtsK [Patescibacteria group bacterium]|nr:DNA translocase FtsK [Patescibacteria group bacterium]MBU2580075.1 DNA translocase FtsK [Patescibacteria group bacterium]